MRSILSEKSLVVILFVAVFITFAFAHEDTKKRMEQVYIGFNASHAPDFASRLEITVKRQKKENNTSSRADIQ